MDDLTIDKLLEVQEVLEKLLIDSSWDGCFSTKQMLDLGFTQEELDALPIEGE